jgi:divalent metal cation (Fe/Co/Zn/Cd) transporter
MSVEAGVAIVAAILAGSVALLSFGLDSLIELASAGTILWLYTGARAGRDAAEGRAQQVVATLFIALALYVTADAIVALAQESRPTTSWAGAAVTLGAIVFMPVLGRAKNRVALTLGSAATAGDAAQSWLCAFSAAGVLLSIILDATLGWWWLDPIVGLAIAGLAVREAREAWQGKGCADCAPVGFSDDPCTGGSRATRTACNAVEGTGSP